MYASLWLAVGLACAQLGPPPESAPANTEQKPAEHVPPPRSAVSKIVAVTVYRGRALVTREVTIPEGDGTVELVVTPMPSQTVDGSLFAEGVDGLRVLATRLRTRAVKDDTRQEVRTKDELLKRLETDAGRLQKEIATQEQDLEYLKKLEGFTGASLSGQAAKGRLDSGAVIALSKFVMETRGAKTNAEVNLRQQLQASTETADFTKRQLTELSNGSSRVERDAVMIIHKTKPAVGVVRLGYLVDSADWTPQYRLRGAVDNAPVRLEYLAAVVQQTGEAWPGVAITLSTARPSLDAAPPELIPLKMAVADATDLGPIDAKDDRSQKLAAELEKPIEMNFPNETPLEDIIKYIRGSTTSTVFPEGIPVYIDPAGLHMVGRTGTSPVAINLARIPLKTTLKLLLEQLGLSYQIKDGVLKITSPDLEDQSLEAGASDIMDASGAPVISLGRSQTTGGTLLNQAAAGTQAEELRIADGQGPSAPAEKDSPSVTFSVAGRFDAPSRRDPLLLEIGRVELPAEYYAKAVPVLTPRVYRLAKLSNKSNFVLLPGDATVYVGGDFVGRMQLPLVAAGESFVAGFGADPQLQVSRRLLHKARSVQGGNQIFTYEFRIGLRNYRPGAVNVQVWDRLPKPQGEAVAVNLVKTSADLSADPLYQRTARMDNLLRWDVNVPAGTVDDKVMYLNYEFRLEYARDLPQPRFLSGGLREAPIGGGAMGGLGGMGGGLRSVKPSDH